MLEDIFPNHIFNSFVDVFYQKRVEEASHIDYELEPVFRKLMAAAKSKSLFPEDLTAIEDNNIKAREEILGLGCGDMLHRLVGMPHTIPENLDVVQVTSRLSMPTYS